MVVGEVNMQMVADELRKVRLKIARNADKNIKDHWREEEKLLVDHIRLVRNEQGINW